MPGYLPFAGALKLPAYTCDNCGFWQRHFEAPPHCPMCLDARHVVPQDGWRFRTTRHACRTTIVKGARLLRLTP